ncbi:hypothetical protein HYC85_020717 [Camellia sinensis]|uniref:Bifunctional inhibitor/plant lipid transfer protein/seed storage helical domain-containing protein n=1 Tax=Camellia sinensis TaxID=4442 RepID=A0A7J7GSB9_CAMSI|nr:hypothetical protein HYC85_020717 [Camellia sinensis]
MMAVLWAGVAAQSSSSCTNAIISMSSCLNYITGNSLTPSSGCCSQFANVVRSQPQCLCQLLSGGGSILGININQTRALALPRACNVQTPPISRCNEPAASPSASPSPSPSTSPPVTTASPTVKTASPAVSPAGTPEAPNTELGLKLYHHRKAAYQMQVLPGWLFLCCSSSYSLHLMLQPPLFVEFTHLTDPSVKYRIIIDMDADEMFQYPRIWFG